ncbi:aminotransferase class I/II-fold pyridoxal phosphate-dependent enzyme [Streptomyces sp. P38-E01]|uniref:Aminotransferase class I/II-fold pyridoxal phosphate-dependent enzyme n=1 Tax=Streptomyces tardus TaxID=2780544 RepID=A0A949JJZ0_9ACTN|nr:aminotransferase class I/II-fold pyridoxal phosphate-dependent enzyme [Streptomyces tardus]MBU7600090.1 aminotransferase class I/II-fold pyridoxal phosphate-dependent enzyme [Streptomyces tardus]
MTGAPYRWPEDLAGLWRHCLERAVREPGWDTRPPWRGDPGLRAALGAVLGLPAAEGGPFVSSGIRPLVAPFALLGRRVVVERPTFLGVVTAFERCGARVLRAEFEEAVRIARPAREHLLWITSPWRNPDGWSLDRATAHRLAEFVADGGVLVQNETYRFFTTAASADGLRVPGAFVAGSMAKAAGPWARLGWLHGGHDGTVPPQIEAHLRAAAPPTVWQRAWSRFAADGGFHLLLDRCRTVAALTAHASSLAGARQHGGASVLVRLDVEEPVEQLRRRHGLRVGDGQDFGAPAGTVRLCFLGCPADCDHRALGRLPYPESPRARKPPGRGESGP